MYMYFKLCMYTYMYHIYVCCFVQDALVGDFCSNLGLCIIC